MLNNHNDYEVDMVTDYMDVVAYMKNIMLNILSLTWLKTLASVVGVGLAWVFDDGRGYYPALIVCILIALDSISGMVCAVRTGQGLSSRKAKRIAWKFIIYGIAILTGRLVDKTLPTPMFAVVIEVFLALTEAQSIIENLGRAGMPIPHKLEKLFTLLKDEKHRKKSID